MSRSAEPRRRAASNGAGTPRASHERVASPQKSGDRATSATDTPAVAPEHAAQETGIFATLASEQAELERLIAELADLDDEDIGRRRDLFTRIAYRLAAHADAEEAVLYSVLVERPETLHEALRARREHGQIEALVEGLRHVPIEHDSWLEGFVRLQYAVRQHVENEQHELFPCAHAVVTDAAAAELDEKYRARRHTDGAHKGSTA
jgi:hemerythrin superfamily protein